MLNVWLYWYNFQSKMRNEFEIFFYVQFFFLYEVLLKLNWFKFDN